MSEKTVYERIMRAYHRGTGVKLSPDDVWVLGEDYFISSQAEDAIEARDLEAEAERNANKPKAVPPIVRKKDEPLEEMTLEELMASGKS